MINMKRIKWGAFVVAIVLAAMGCGFCWNCPMDWLYGEVRGCLCFGSGLA